MLDFYNVYHDLCFQNAGILEGAAPVPLRVQSMWPGAVGIAVPNDRFLLMEVSAPSWLNWNLVSVDDGILVVRFGPDGRWIKSVPAGTKVFIRTVWQEPPVCAQPPSPPDITKLPTTLTPSQK